MRLLDRCDHPGTVLVLLTVLTAFGSANANAQRAEPGAAPWVHESWTVKDGLPVNSIRAIIQDRTGYIWAATFDGLVRFDGRAIHRLQLRQLRGAAEQPDHPVEGGAGRRAVARHRAGSHRSLPRRRVHQHRIRRRKARRGLVICSWTRRASSGSGHRRTVDGAARSPRARRARNARRARHHHPPATRRHLWVGTNGAGVFRVARDGRVTRLAADPALDADVVARMIEDASGTVWIAGAASALAVARPAGAGRRRLRPPSSSRICVRAARDARDRACREPRPACTGSMPTRRVSSQPLSGLSGLGLWAEGDTHLDRRRPGGAARRSTGLHAAGAPDRLGRALRPRGKPLARHGCRRAASPQAGALHDL